MIITKRTAGLARRGSKFIKSNVLVTSDPGTYTWRLTNGLVTFDFLSDETTGVRLDSFFNNEGEVVWRNHAKTLWILNTIRDIRQHTTTNEFHTNRVDIFPSKSTFVPPSVVPTTNSAGTKSFAFVWSNVQYNRDNPDVACTVTLTASLAANESALDITVSVTSRENINPATPGVNEVTVSAVHLPKFIFKAVGEDDAHDQWDVLGIPVGLGQSIAQPYYYFRTPRFALESFHYNYDTKRVYHFGQPGASPNLSVYKANYGSPGYLSIPCFVYGNRQDKEGFLIYCRDPDGLHAKGFQWFSDDKGFHLRVYDKSDHELEPYGMGGKIPETAGDDLPAFTYGNKTNTIAWSLRIRPFVSPTRWVEWYGYSIYKDEEVPVQESNGWMPKSFYERYRDNEMDLKAIEAPIVLNAYGHLSGTTEDIVTAASFVQEELRTLTNPYKDYNPQFPLHIQTTSFDAQPRSDLGQYNVSGNYFGWQSWCNQFGVNYGVEGFKSPDHLPINSFYSGTFSDLTRMGIHTLVYHVFSYVITSGAQWTIDNSGQDLGYKIYKRKDNTYTAEDYHRDAQAISYNSTTYVDQANYQACFVPDVCYNHAMTIASGLTEVGAGCYHDTYGLFGRGCYAETHKYRSNGVEVNVRHPKGSFTHFYNKAQKRWGEGFTNTVRDNYKRVGLYDSDCSGGYLLARTSEYMSDACIADVPVGLYYGVAHPYLSTFKVIAGTSRPDSVNQVIVPSEYPLLTVGIQPPVWSQKCPAYSIVYGDRTSLNTWAWPHISNVVDVSGFFTNGEYSGIHPITNETVFYPQTTNHKVMQWAAWFARDIGMTKRVSISYQSRDYEAFNPGWSAISEDLSGVFYSATWSGLYGYIKQYMRLQSYEPDYICHGDVEHPLDSWTVNQSINDDFARGLYTHSAMSSTEAPSYSGQGMDVIVHNVYRKRDSNNLLISLINWFSGTETFQASIDPSTYGISGGYEVYDLDVATEDHGSKTLLAVNPAGVNYSLNYSLGSMTIRNIEIVSQGIDLNSSFYQDLAVSHLPIAYSYGAIPVTTSSISIPYSYGTSVYQAPDDPLQGFKAPATQQIVNNLPQWMAIRQSTDSRGWKLVNSWGVNMEDLITNTAANLSDVWLLTSDTKYRSRISRSDISEKEIIADKPKRNILFNSSFSIRDAVRFGIPAGWSDLGKSTLTYLSDRSAVTPSSVVLTDSSMVSQSINLDDTLVGNMVASIYLLSNNSDTDVKLIVTVETTDGPVKNYSASITSRSDDWKRLVLPIKQVNSRVRKIKFTVKSESDGLVYVSAPMLENGDTVSGWSASINDALPYLNSSTRFNMVQAVSHKGSKKIPIYGIQDEEEFIRVQIPTRLERHQMPNYSIQSFTTGNKGRKVDFFKHVYEVDWSIVNGYVVERSSNPSQFDFFGSYGIRDLRFFDANTYGTREDPLLTSTTITSCVRANLLYCVVKEEFRSVSRYVVKVLVPRTPPNGSTYLESIIDFELPIDIDYTYSIGQSVETITSLSISEVDTSLLCVTTSLNRKMYYKLYFDYYYFNNRNNQLYTTETYNGYKIQVL